MDVQRRNLFRGKNLYETEVVHLPWLKSNDLFYDKCTRCEKCLRACPENIIEKADGGFPAVNFKMGECSFCGVCAQICPENIFSTDLKKKAWNFVAIVSQRCLSFQQISCRSCQDSCTYKAIKFTLKTGITPFPEINLQLCTGCGACVVPCPNFAIEIST